MASFSTHAVTDSRPANVGIKAMEFYVPQWYVSQADLEQYDGVSQGKYTIGLGQTNMAVCGQQEDINSVCMSAVANLMEKYNIPWDAIGRLEVGTESLVDKSKAVKTSLMDLFAAHGNTDIEGVDSKNACYGGTAAVFNSAAWVESSAWDGRYAIAIAGDIAVYEKGPARPTGGAGVFAMLIGPEAPLVLEPRLRATHMENVWDFYKPTMVSEYPRVDGHLSNACYLRALDICYQRYADKYEAAHGQPWTMDKADFAIFHAPYNKLVQKSMGRFVYQEFLRHPEALPELAPMKDFAQLSNEETYVDRDFQKQLSALTKPHYQKYVQDSEYITKECGNSYCGSLYAGLLSLIDNKAKDLVGKRIMMFSYGSGLAATLFSIKVNEDVSFIKDTVQVKPRLESRTKLEPSTFEQELETRENNYTKFDYQIPQGAAGLRRGTYFLTEIDALERRKYSRAYSTLARRAMHTTTPAARLPAAQSLMTTALRGLRFLKR
ncbi:uncharacterized protein MONBRDRAFT_11388 [Monosiga brevicollis MX1]|uniref:Hydroxymethylglutaryl-CoA synthase n=1 Tax=Monosiga brevicollis TaxID=81824 RepID=A9V939_MONBE|nr:uncharacterized protein MONBRDRAFT_11388 [Monosiga brevicollis MX1]EDQ86062.1 predicted protein [Monosiga brevicollis MX1]|eukprot:XP_001749256.1 hypothetical protein [Monosiga brevicollis MX1]